MGFSRILPAYAKLLDFAVCTVNSPAGNLKDPEATARWVWDRLGLMRRRRGYSLERVRQIIEEQARVPDGASIPLSDDLRRKLDRLGRAIKGG